MSELAQLAPTPAPPTNAQAGGVGEGVAPPISPEMLEFIGIMMSQMEQAGVVPSPEVMNPNASMGSGQGFSLEGLASLAQRPDMSQPAPGAPPPVPQAMPGGVGEGVAPPTAPPMPQTLPPTQQGTEMTPEMLQQLMHMLQNSQPPAP